MIGIQNLIQISSQFDRVGKLIELFSALVSKSTTISAGFFNQFKVLKLLKSLLDDCTASRLEVIYRCCSVLSFTKDLCESSNTDCFLAV